MMRASMFALMLLVGVCGAMGQEFPAPVTPSAVPQYAPWFSPDVQAPLPLVARTVPVQVLERMTLEERANAVIAIEPGPSAPAAAVTLCRDVESTWRSGDYEGAMTKLAGLVTLVDMKQVELSIQWKTPRPVTGANLLALNTRVGTIDSVRAVALTTDSANTRLFAILSQSGDGYGGSWHVFMSTDGGSTWTNPTTISLIGNAPKIGAAPTHGYVYVGYVPPGGQTLRIRRFTIPDGAYAPLTNGLGYLAAATLTGTDTITSLAASSNYLTFNNRPYFGFSTSSHKARFVWSDPTRDSVWSEVSDSAATKVKGGISIAYCMTPPNHHHFFMSYADTLANMCIDTIDQGGSRFMRAFSYGGADGLTSMSGYGDTALCAFDYYRGGTAHFRYVITYDAGKNWNYGFPEDTTQTHESPAAMLERGQGMGIFYRFYTTAREGRFVYRGYQGPGAWSTPVAVTDYSPHYWPYGIAALGNKTFGMLYITYNSSPAPQAAIFVKYQAGTTGVAESSPVSPGTYKLYQNYPNPFNPATQINYDLPAAGSVRIAVYDIIGREVAVLVNNNMEPGSHSVTWNAQGFASGVYFCRIQVRPPDSAIGRDSKGGAGQFTAVNKLVLMK